MRTYLYTQQPITYDGRQLSPHWLYRQFDLLGDAVAAFTGPCRVELTEMVDLAHVKAAAPLRCRGAGGVSKKLLTDEHR